MPVQPYLFSVSHRAEGERLTHAAYSHGGVCRQETHLADRMLAFYFDLLIG